MAQNVIFRQAALERLSTPDRLDAGLTVVNPAGWALVWGLTTLVIGGLIWACIVIVPVTVKGEGILLSPGGVLDVTSASAGRVQKFAAQVGDIVHVDQVVAEIAQPQMQQELAAAEADLKDAIDLRTRTDEFQRRREAARTATTDERRKALLESIAALTANIKLLEERVAIREDLAKKGFSTRDRYLDSKLELGKQHQELATNKVTLTQLNDDEVKTRTEDERELLSLDLKAASAERKVAALKEHLQNETRVKSPYEGKIAELKVNVGELVERGTGLFTILPKDLEQPVVVAATEPEAAGRAKTFGPLIAVVYVPPTFGKQVHDGEDVRLAMSTARREEFGFVSGRVRTVADIPSTAEGMQRSLKNKQLVQTLSNNAAPFEVVIDLYADPTTHSGYRWSSSRGPDIKLNSGTLVSAEIEVRTVPILALAVPQLRQLLERMFGVLKLPATAAAGAGA
jgi:HlyD family secretion protein